MKDKTIAVWFSCGIASAVAAKKTVEIYGDKNTVRVLNSPVAEEDLDNRRFLHDVEEWIGQKIEIVTNPAYPDNSADSVWRKRKYMSGIAGAPCTLELKKKPRQLWEKENHVDYHVLGFVAEERDRHERFVRNERDNVLPVLIDLNISKPEAAQIVVEAGIKPPRVYDWGYANGNCIGCPKGNSPTYWNLVRKTHPEVFEARAKLSREVGARLVRVKGERIFLDELDPNEEGAPIKSMQSECGLFCEESE